MKCSHALSSFAFALVFTSPVAVFAQPAPATTPPPAAAAPAAAPVASDSARFTKVEEHIKTLHAKLGITAAQQPQFDAFANVMRDQSKAMYASREDKVDNDLSAPEEMQRYGAMAQTHADSVKQMLPSFQALYDSLSPAQKKKADALFAHSHKHAGA